MLAVYPTKSYWRLIREKKQYLSYKMIGMHVQSMCCLYRNPAGKLKEKRIPATFQIEAEAEAWFQSWYISEYF